MQKDSFSVTDHFRKLRDRANLSLDELARLMGYARASSIQRYEDPTAYTKDFFSVDLTQKISQALVGRGEPSITNDEVWALALPEIRMKLFDVGDDVISADNAKSIVNDVKLAAVTMPNRFSMPQDVPVMGTAACNHSHGAFKLDASVIDYVRRPPGLAAAKDVYALYVEGDSMEPKFIAGDLVFVHPRKPVRIGDAVVVQFVKGENEPVEAMIAILAKRTSGQVYFEKYNPNKTINFNTNEIVAIHKILAMNELFGI